MKIDFKWNKSIDSIAFNKTGGKQGRLFLANEAKRLMTPYVPFENGALSQVTRVYLEGDNAIIHYLSPYAHYQYVGKLYVDHKTQKGAIYSPEIGFFSRKGVYKQATSKPLNYSKFRHPLATSEWDKAMLTARKADLVKAMENYLKRGK